MVAARTPLRPPRIHLLAPVLVLMLVVLTVGAVRAGTSPAALLGSATLQESSEETRADVGRVSIIAEPGIGVSASEIAEAWGPAISEAWPQFSALFGAEPAQVQYLRFVKSIDQNAITGMRWVNDTTWVSHDGAVAIIAFGAFSSLTPEESTNVLRNVLSRGFMQSAAKNSLPGGLADGIARYLEKPIVARQARLGSLVQSEHVAGTLPDWNGIITASDTAVAPETRVANGYALVAFIVDRYGLASLREFVTAFSTHPTWPEALSASIGQTETQLAPAWTQFLPRWFASGWRENAAAAFDLGRAQELFDRGAYEAAAAEASRSQRLFTDIGDEAGLARVEVLLAECALGLQADSMMSGAQAALEAHDYKTVQDLVAEAESLYANLPESHRPAKMIEQYASFASQGLAAEANLASAQSHAGNWLDVSSARADAVAAGNTFAALGDAERATAAEDLVHDIDQRLWRMRLLFSALVVVLAAWLAAWLWYRQPSRLRWSRSSGAARFQVGR